MEYYFYNPACDQAEEKGLGAIEWLSGFVLRGMRNAAKGAGGNQANFLNLFNEYVKQPILDNPLLLRKVGW